MPSFRFNVASDDEAILAWRKAQGNLSFSLRALVVKALEEYGTIDYARVVMDPKTAGKGIVPSKELLERKETTVSQKETSKPSEPKTQKPEASDVTPPEASTPEPSLQPPASKPPEASSALVMDDDGFVDPMQFLGM